MLEKIRKTQFEVDSQIRGDKMFFSGQAWLQISRTSACHAHCVLSVLVKPQKNPCSRESHNPGFRLSTASIIHVKTVVDFSLNIDINRQQVGARLFRPKYFIFLQISEFASMKQPQNSISLPNPREIVKYSQKWINDHRFWGIKPRK